MEVLLHDHVDFYQNWFIFDLISDCLAIESSHVEEVLVRKKQRPYTISTFHFPTLLRKWYSERSTTSSQANLTRVMTNCKIARDTLSALGDLPPAKSPLSMWDVVCMSMLIDRVAIGAQQLRLRSVSESFAESPMRDYLVNNGWCISSVFRLHETLGDAGMYNATFLDPPGAEKNADSAQLRRQHACCTDSKCVGDNVREEDYRTQHDNHCNDPKLCNWFTVNNFDLMSCLDTDNIPLVEVNDQQCAVRPLSEDETYVAISHVWSDGLGNPSRNSLPMCQINRIVEAIRRIDKWRKGPIRFWIDTLCCPVQDVQGRKKAIRMMQQTYRKASEIYVLESYIASHDAANLSFTEIAMLLHCSKYQRRLWTLAERTSAARIVSPGNPEMLRYLPEWARKHKFIDLTGKETLMDRIMFHFCDVTLGGVEISQMSRFTTDIEFAETINLSPKPGLSDESLRYWQSFQHQKQLSAVIRASPSYAVTNLAQTATFRQSSRKEDEAICLANALELSATTTQTILATSSQEDRMAHFWSSLGQIPASVLFWGGCQRLGTQGLRWAPLSLLECAPVSIAPDRVANTNTGPQKAAITSNESAQLSREGLIVNFPAWQLTPKEGPGMILASTFVLKDDNIRNVYFLYKAISSAGTPTLPVRNMFMLLLDDPSTRTQHPSGTCGLVVAEYVCEAEGDDARDGAKLVHSVFSCAVESRTHDETFFPATAMDNASAEASGLLVTAMKVKETLWCVD